MPEFSIITTTLNAGETLETCLDSLCAQSVTPEHIVVDAGSTDNTQGVIERHAIDSHIITVPGLGIYEGLNRGLELCRGEIVGFLNADDFYPSNNVLENVRNVFSDPGVQACYGDLVYVDSRNPEKVTRYWKSGGYSANKFYRGWMPPHPTFFARKSVYDHLGGFNTELGTAADYELMLRFLFKYRIEVVYIPGVMVHMRTGGVSNRSLLNRIRAHRMDRKAWAVNGLQPRPWTLTLKPLRKLGQWVIKGVSVD